MIRSGCDRDIAVPAPTTWPLPQALVFFDGALKTPFNAFHSHTFFFPPGLRGDICDPPSAEYADLLTENHVGLRSGQQNVHFSSYGLIKDLTVQINHARLGPSALRD